MNPFLLAISYFIHLIATVVWIGGLALLALVIWPAARRVLAEDARHAALLREVRQRFNRLANLSLVVLFITGMIQTTGDPNYNGLLVFDNDWSRAILAKHIAILGMIGVGVALQWGIAPAQERAALRRAAGKADPAQEAALARRERLLNSVNLLLGIVVLVFTAVATAL